MRVRRRAELVVAGRIHTLLPGWYVYTGSARRGLDARVSRHLAAEKRVRWHVDHLTTHPAATPVGALLIHETRTSAGVDAAGETLGVERPRAGAPQGRLWSGGRRTLGDPVDGAHSAGSMPFTECRLNRAVGLIVGSDAPIKGFGAGDCRSGCPAHLWRGESRLTLETLAAGLEEAGLGRPAIVRSPEPQRRPAGAVEREVRGVPTKPHTEVIVSTGRLGRRPR